MREEKESGEKLYLRLYQSIEQDIINGKLKNGDRLPSYRRSAQKYGISISTVKQAYAKLAEMDIVEIIQGSGCYVRSVNYHDYFAEQIVIENFDAGQVLEQPAINFSSASPYTPTYPIKEFESILRAMLENGLDPALFAYGRTQGNACLRTALAMAFTSWRQPVLPEHIHITGGGQQGIDMVCKLFRNRPFTVAVENPGYPIAVNSFANGGADIFPVSLESDGADFSALERLLARRKIDLFYVMTNYQSPTNICWSEEKKRALLSLAERHGFYIFEDDCWSELSFDGTVRTPIKALDAASRVIYLKSFSKILMPGLRVGYVIAPPELDANLVATKFFSDIASPELLQVCLASFMENGGLARHIEWLRGYYKEKHDLMKQLLEEAPSLRMVHDTNGGLCFWVEILPKVDWYAFYRRMRERNIRLLPGNLFSRDGTHGNFMRLSYAVPGPEAMRTGIRRIEETLASL